MSSKPGAYQKKQVRIWFIQNDLSYRKLAILIEVSPAYLHQVVTGVRRVTPKLRERLAKEGFPVELIEEAPKAA